MEQNSFLTETDVKFANRKSYKITAIMFVVLSLLSCLGFLNAWQTFAFFEGIVLISCIITIFLKKHNKYNCDNCELYFENDRLYITNRATNETFEVYDIQASDFVISQTKKEKEINYCDIVIKNTIFIFCGIKNYRELKEYISENYQ